MPTWLMKCLPAVYKSVAKGTAQAQRAFKTTCLISVFIIRSKKSKFPGGESQQAGPPDPRTPAREPKKGSVPAFQSKLSNCQIKEDVDVTFTLKHPPW